MDEVPTTCRQCMQDCSLPRTHPDHQSHFPFSILDCSHKRFIGGSWNNCTDHIGTSCIILREPSKCWICLWICMGHGPGWGYNCVVVSLLQPITNISLLQLRIVLFKVMHIAYACWHFYLRGYRLWIVCFEKCMMMVFYHLGCCRNLLRMLVRSHVVIFSATAEMIKLEPRNYQLSHLISKAKRYYHGTTGWDSLGVFSKEFNGFLQTFC